MIRCQICKGLFKQLQMHLKVHNITVEEYKKKYNVGSVWCGLQRKALSKKNIGNKYGVGNINTKGLKHTDKQKENNKGNKFGVGKRSKETRERNRKAALKGWTDKRRRNSRIRMNKMYADGTLIPGTGVRCKMYPVKNHIGKEVKVRGRLELRFAELLNRLGIRWIIPKYKTYTLNGKEHKYFCDFYLKDYRWYAEVKSRYYYNEHKEEVLAKKRMMIEKGKRRGFRYKIMFEKNIKEFELNVKDVTENIYKEQKK